MKLLPEHGNVMTLEEFGEMVSQGTIGDMDGVGYFVKDGMMSAIMVSLDQFWQYYVDIPTFDEIRAEGYDKVIWFNN